MDKREYFAGKQNARLRTKNILLSTLGLFALSLFLFIVTLTPNAAAVDCSNCHSAYANEMSSSNSYHSGVDRCIFCHASYSPSTFPHPGTIVNESNTCRNCHIDNVSGFYERHRSTSDCTDCHFANTTVTFEFNSARFKHSHNLTIEYNFYRYNQSGFPVRTNGGVGYGMFPYYTCTLTCHEYDPDTGIEGKTDEATKSWYNSSHARSRHSPSSNDSYNNCAKCKSPPNYNASLSGTNPVIAEADWQGIQCRVCHNLHDRRFPNNTGQSGLPIAFYNSTLTSEAGYAVYEQVFNSTQLCEKCHTGSTHDSKFAGTHKDTAGFNCTNCHMNSTFNDELHKFEVKNTTSGVTGCEVCHNYESSHTTFIKSNHDGLVQCEACHDKTVSRNGTNYAVSSDNNYGIYKNSSNVWVTYKLSHGTPADWPLHNISKSVTCTKCHGSQSVFNGTIAIDFPIGVSGYYIGNSTKCAACHPDEYAVWRNTSHTSKIINSTDAQLREYPAPPNGDGNWSNVSYAIGGHWKIRYVDNSGYILTNGTVNGTTPGGPGLTQFNVLTQTWTNYNRNATKPYNCGHCHTTGYLSNVSNDTMEPWKTLRQLGVYPDGVYNNSLAPGFTGWWAENSIGCEACHGQGGDHVNNPSKDNIRNATNVTENPGICGDCHSRPNSSLYGEYQDFRPYPDGVNDTLLNDTLYDDSPMPTENYSATGGHHEQWEDWKASLHSNSSNADDYITCVSCHGGHNITDAAYAGGPTGRVKFLNGTVYPAVVNQTCTYCHLTSATKHRYYNVNSQCITCHMTKNRKSSNVIDIRSHWFTTNFSVYGKNKNGEVHGNNFPNFTALNTISSMNVSCRTCHSTYTTEYNASGHNKTLNSSAPACTDCHITGYTTEVINETTTCRNSGCHSGLEESHGNHGFGQNFADCKQCHFPNTTVAFNRNTSMFARKHNMTVEYNFYNYNLSGMPLESDHSTSKKGMFPYFTCTLTCHDGSTTYKLENETIAWNQSGHAQVPNSWVNWTNRTVTSASYPLLYGRGCITCKSPTQFNGSLISRVTPQDWQGIQCRVCHNLHNDTYSGNGTPINDIAFYNGTLSNISGSPVYDIIENASVLCEKCHTGYHNAIAYSGFHETNLSFTCASCHMNSTINNGSTHTFGVNNSTSGETGCEACHQASTAHSGFYEYSRHSASVTCEACHDNNVYRNSSDYVVNISGFPNAGIWKDTTTNKWSTYTGRATSPTTRSLHNVSRYNSTETVYCNKCHGARSAVAASGLIAPAFRGDITSNTTSPLISGYNLVLVLLYPEPAINASNLTYPVTGGIPGVTKVMGWNSSGQSWNSYEYITASGIYLGTDFTIDGYKAYFLKGNASTVGQTYTFRGRQ